MSRAKILIVEDEAIIAEHVREDLVHLGYHVCATAATGAEAVRAAEETRPDLVLMDIVLGGGSDGTAAAAFIHSSLDIPVVYLTGHADEVTLSCARLTRPYGYLIKPFRDLDLRCTIEMALEMHRLYQELKESHEALAAYSSSLETMVEERTTDLEKSRVELKKYSESLEKANEALKMVIESIEEQKKGVEKNITQNIFLTVLPIIDQLKSLDLSEAVAFLLESLEVSLNNLLSSFRFDIVKNSHLLTPREIRICEMIRSGLSSKQIAKIMGISSQTVLVHRKNIRKKLQLDKSRRNLASFLTARRL